MNNPKEVQGIYVKDFETEELGKKRIITKLSLAQKAQGKENIIFRWEKK